MLSKKIEDLLVVLLNQSLFHYVLLVLITVFAAGLRFFKLGEWSFWIDEIYTINHATRHFSNLELIFGHIPPAENWIPASVMLTAQVLNVWGVSEWSARLTSTVIGILTLPILYVPIRKIFGSQVALTTLLLLAVSPWHIFWSQNARFYTSLMLLYTLSAFLFYLGVERNRPVYFVGFYILFYFALSERLVAAFILPTIFSYIISLWIFRFERPPGLHSRNLLLFLAPIFLTIAYEVIRYMMSGTSMTTTFITDFGKKQVEDPLRLLIAIIYNIGFPIISLGSVAGVYLLLKRNRTGLFLFLSATVPIILLVLLNPIMFTKDRYVFITLTFWLILVALAIKELISQTQGLGKLIALGALVVLLADAAGSNILYYHVNNGNRRDWRSAFEIVKEKSRDDDVVVAWWPEFSPFYLGREILPYKDVTVEDVLESGQRYWFVIDSETVWGNIPMRDWLEEHGHLIDILYLRLPEDDFNLRIYLYDPVLYPAEE
jgi:uncharacterized membrane protein